MFTHVTSSGGGGGPGLCPGAIAGIVIAVIIAVGGGIAVVGVDSRRRGDGERWRFIRRLLKRGRYEPVVQAQ